MGLVMATTCVSVYRAPLATSKAQPLLYQSRIYLIDLVCCQQLELFSLPREAEKRCLALCALHRHHRMPTATLISLPNAIRKDFH